MTNKAKFSIGVLSLLIVIQIGVIGCLFYSKYSDLIFNNTNQKETEETNTTPKDIYDSLLDILNNSEVSVKMQKTITNENNEPIVEDKEINKDTISEIISKLKTNTNIEELPDGIGLEFPPYSYIVTYKTTDIENTFKVLVTNESNKAWVFMNNKFKLYTFNDSINDFMKSIYEK